MQLNDALPVNHSVTVKRKLQLRDHLPFMCRYKSKLCFNPRTFKRNGAPHNLCEEHRAQANNNQLRFDLRRRLGATHSPARGLQLEAARARSHGSRFAKVARIASLFCREVAARRLAHEQQHADDLIDLTDPACAPDNCGGGESISRHATETDTFASSPSHSEPRLDSFDSSDACQANNSSGWSDGVLAAVDSLEVEMEEEIDSWRQLAVQWRDSTLDPVVDQAGSEVLDYECQRDSLMPPMVWM